MNTSGCCLLWLEEVWNASVPGTNTTLMAPSGPSPNFISKTNRQPGCIPVIMSWTCSPCPTKPRIHTYRCIHTQTCSYIHLGHICTYTYLYMHMHTCTYAHRHIHTHVHMFYGPHVSKITVVVVYIVSLKRSRPI